MNKASEASADLYEFIFSRDDARRGADRLHDIIGERVPAAESLLDVACGTGWHLERLHEWYEVEGLDYSSGMLRHARKRLPGVPLHLADMKSFHLDRTFDVVLCLSSSVASMRTVEDLNRAVGTMAGHTSPGGLLIVEPWDFPGDPDAERPWLTTVESEDRSVALLETTTLQGNAWEQETHYLIWSRELGIEHRVETQTLGAFTRADYEAAIELATLAVEFDTAGLLGRGLFIGEHL